MSNDDYHFSDLTKVNSAELSKEERAEAIAQLNDTFRQTFSGGKVVGTQRIGALTADERTRIPDAVREFTGFQKGDSPYGERDFSELKVGA
ncbi:hypothetical protein [Roseibium sp. SCP14]|uniref:hypothetical protein n=1 Tax=Roseibium sp. SCP14 TaxID=3141375 RepID=UPI003338200D